MKVAKLIDAYTVAITGGEEAGIDVGDVLAVAREVIDPDTGESLGWYDRVRLEVTEAHPRFCVAQTFDVFDRYAPRAVVSVDIGDDVRLVCSPGQELVDHSRAVMGL